MNDHHVVNTLSWGVKKGAALPLNAFGNVNHFIQYAHHHTGESTIEIFVWCSLLTVKYNFE